jgi:hypothetical protein
MIFSHWDSASIPKGYQTVLLRAEDRGAGLAVCLIVRSAQAGGPAGVLLRETIDASIYLGCIVDRSGNPKSWVEIWVQNVDRVASSFRAQLESVTNQLMDKRWAERVDLFRSLDPGELIEIGWENENPASQYVNPAEPALCALRDPVAKRPLKLCRDETALANAGLPSYASSLHRYLWTGEAPAVAAKIDDAKLHAEEPLQDESPVFVAATKDAPLRNGVVSARELLEGMNEINLGAGFILVRLLQPLKIGEFADIIGGKSWSGFDEFFPGTSYEDLVDADRVAQGGGHLFNGRAGRAGRLLEIFHLKLNLILQSLIETSAAIRFQQLPFLNLTGDSFHVRISKTGSGLPYFWTAKVRLVESASAIPLNLPTSSTRYFLPSELPGPSIYRPQLLSLPARGQSTLRIRKILPPTQDGITIEATIATDERLNVSASDLIHVQVTLPVGRIDLYGHVDQSQALARGETRLKTLPQNLSSSSIGALERATGVPISNATFEVLPLLSSPCDLYALAVLAIRILLVDEENSLPIAVDEMLSLARQVAAEFDPTVVFSMRLKSIVESDTRWPDSLSPKRLARDPETRAMAAEVIPIEIWWDLLGLVLRLFPGTGPDSFCRDLGDAPSLALDRIFEAPIDAFEQLQLRTRSLVVTDWNQNIEIHDAIYDLISKYGNK